MKKWRKKIDKRKLMTGLDNDETKLDKVRQSQTKLDKARQSQTKLDKVRQGQAKFGQKAVL